MPTNDITFVREELLDTLDRYERIADCVNQRVKDKGEKYLPRPSPEVTEKWNRERYAAYSERAVFYDVTARTLAGMITQVFARDPIVELPEALKVLEADATGSGLSLVQLAKDSVRDVVGWGRGGILTDYPSVNGATQQQAADGTIAPTLTIYDSKSIINWAEKKAKIGRKIVKTLVVLQETYEERNGFAVEKKPQWRELALDDNGVYYQQLWREAPPPSAAPPASAEVPLPTKAGEGPITTPRPEGFRVYPKRGDGKLWTEIPFEFIGAVNNDSTIDEPPMYGMAELNIGHFRNSADYEEATFLIGQPTPWFGGLTDDWVSEVFKNEPILLGSRNAVLLPENSQAGLLQVSDNSMPMEGMRHKETQMVALGARLVENRQVRRTLGEVKEASASETSILASCANNVSSAFQRALVWADAFASKKPDPTNVKFKLNVDFAITELAPEERTAMIAELQGGLLAWTEIRDRYRRGGLATLPDDEAKAAIDKETAEKEKREIDKTTQIAKATQPPAPAGNNPRK